MNTYRAPLEDMVFLIDEVLDIESQLGSLPRFAELGVGPELTTALLDEAAKFAADVVSPLRRVGDEHPAVCEDRAVKTSPAMTRPCSNWAPAVGWASVPMPSTVARACRKSTALPPARCGTGPTWPSPSRPS